MSGGWTPERRAVHSARTKAAMASPEVRERISVATREGMAVAAIAQSRELKILRKAWANTSPWVRKQFLSELLDPICLSSPVEPEPENTVAEQERIILNTDLTKPPTPGPGAARGPSQPTKRERPEVIQNRIAQKLGADGWLILQSLSESKLDQLTAMERRGTLDATILVRVAAEAKTTPDHQTGRGGRP